MPVPDPHSVHKIRLRGPWQAALLRADHLDQPAVNLVVGSKIRLPIHTNWRDGPGGQWLGPDFRGLVLLERSFGRPTGLDESQQVWLVVEAPHQHGSITLNESPLGKFQAGDPSFSAPIRFVMQARNCLQIQVEFSDDSSRRSANTAANGLLGEVRLEIRETE